MTHKAPPMHKQPSKPQTLEDALAADAARYARDKMLLEYLENKQRYQKEHP